MLSAASEERANFEGGGKRIVIVYTRDPEGSGFPGISTSLRTQVVSNFLLFHQCNGFVLRVALLRVARWNTQGMASGPAEGI